jgi:hypothetical protein
MADNWQFRGWKDTTTPDVGINPGIRRVPNPDGSLELWGQGEAVYEGSGSPSSMWVHSEFYKQKPDGTWNLLNDMWCQDTAPVHTSKSNPYLCPSYGGDFSVPAGTIANPVTGVWKVQVDVCLNDKSGCNNATSPHISL